LNENARKSHEKTSNSLRRLLDYITPGRHEEEKKQSELSTEGNPPSPAAQTRLVDDWEKFQCPRSLPPSRREIRRSSTGARERPIDNIGKRQRQMVKGVRRCLNMRNAIKNGVLTVKARDSHTKSCHKEDLIDGAGGNGVKNIRKEKHTYSKACQKKRNNRNN